MNITETTTNATAATQAGILSSAILLALRAQQAAQSQYIAAKRNLAAATKSVAHQSAIDATFPAWREANPTANVFAFHLPDFDRISCSCGGWPTSHHGRNPQASVARYTAESAAAMDEWIATDAAQAALPKTLREYLTLCLVANVDSLELPQVLFAARIGALVDVASEAKDSLLSVDEWQEAWEAFSDAGHDLPEVEKEEFVDDYSASNTDEDGAEVSYDVECCTTTWTVKDIGSHQRTLVADYGGEHGGNQSGWGGEAADEWGSWEDNEGNSSSDCIRGLVMAHGDEDPDDQSIESPDEPTVDVSEDKPMSTTTKAGILAEPGRVLRVVEITVGKFQAGGNPNAPTVYAVTDIPSTTDSAPFDSLNNAEYDSESEAWSAVQECLADAEREHGPKGEWLTDGESEPTLYDDEDDAKKALSAWLVSDLTTYDDPAGMTYSREESGKDEGQGYLASDGADEDDEVYHLDLAEMLACYATQSFAPVIPAVAAALGMRATMAALREQQEQADAILSERAESIWVRPQDSLATGNCPAGTEDFRAELSRRFGGEVGGATAACILSTRRDAYTLRACRSAALRSANLLHTV